MKRRTISILLTLLTCVLLFTSVLAQTADVRVATDNTEAASEVSPRATRVPMKVCVEKMNYYGNSNLTGNPINFKKFEDVVYGEDVGNNVIKIHNKNGSLLGYCSAFALVDQDARFFAEFPFKTDTTTGQISNLVDLRKYILILGANITCNEDSYVAVQYSTAMKLITAAKEIYKQYGFILNVTAAHTSDTCECGENHSTGGILQLSIIKNSESSSESIPLYANEGTPEQTIGEIAQILADNSLIRISDTDCFADADNSSYLQTTIDRSTLTYSVWE